MATSSEPPQTPSRSATGPVGGHGPTGANGPTGATDGRQRRRERNRDAVVDALLELFRSGNLRPGIEEIAGRAGLSPRSLFRYFDDTDDLTRTAISRFEQQALPLLPIDIPDDAATATKAWALVDQRFRLFDLVGPAATVSRLRAPFQPLLAAELSRNRAFLRMQIATLFAPELARLRPDQAVSALAAADVLCSFESYDLLGRDQALTPSQAKAAMTGAVTVVFEPPR
jgi:AcrR family transcriptional regulator